MSEAIQSHIHTYANGLFNERKFLKYLINKNLIIFVFSHCMRENVKHEEFTESTDDSNVNIAKLIGVVSMNYLGCKYVPV